MEELKKQLFELNKMSKKSVALYHRFALAVGVSDSALGVLYALNGAEAPCSQYDLCGEWAIPKQTINTTVSALQNKGLISMSRADGARNKKNLALTAAGNAFAKSSVDVLFGAELDALGTLSPEERELYISLNKKYNEALSCRLNGVLAGAAD